jgi:hypothetical protein
MPNARPVVNNDFITLVFIFIFIPNVKLMFIFAC